MTADRWARIHDLFELCLDQPPESRTSFLAAQPVEAEVRSEVQRLLNQDRAAGGFMDESPDLVKELRNGARAQFSPGERLANRFELLRLIGRGGMGEVYAALDVDLEEQVAVKVLHADLLGDAGATQRFRRELQLARKVTHPHVCRLFDLGRHTTPSGDVFFLTMELVEGETLAERLRRTGPMKVDEARPIVEQILHGLAAAHQAGIIHRDLKPSNIMLTGSRAVIMDFGLARRDSTLMEGSLTSSGKVLGTLLYMAPEQLQGEPVTERTDIYAIGLLLYEITTGQRPFGAGDSVAGALKRLTQAPAPPANLATDLPRNWSRTITAALEIDPQHRPATAQVLLDHLQGQGPRRHFPLSRRQIITATAIPAAAVSLYWAVPRLSRWHPFGDAKLPGTKILMTPLANKTGDPDFDQIAWLLERQVAQSSKVEFLEKKRIAELRARMNLDVTAELSAEQYREIALRDGAAGVLSGAISNLGTDFELRLRLEGVASSPLRSRLSFAKDFTASSKRELWTALSEAGRWVRRQAGEALAEIGKLDMPAEDVTTNSWEAWRLYTEASERARKDRLAEAIALLKEATRYDPAFAMAWRDRADYEIRCKEFLNGYASWSQAIAVLDQRRNTSIEACRTRGMFYEDTGNLAQAEQQYRALLALTPGDYRGRLYLASVLRKQHRNEEALAMIERLVTDFPDKPLTSTHAIYFYLAQQRLDLARASAKRLRDAGLVTWADYADYTIAMTAKDWIAAQRSAESLAKSKDTGWQVRGPLVLASFAGYRGDLGKCREAVQLALRQAHQEAEGNWGTRLPLWDIYLQLRQDPSRRVELRQQFNSLPTRSSAPDIAVDYALVGYALGVPLNSGVAKNWPRFPSFEAPRAQIALLAQPEEKRMASLLTLTRSLPYYRQRDIYEFAAAVAQQQRWPDAAIASALQQGKPSYWWGNEANLPARAWK